VSEPADVANIRELFPTSWRRSGLALGWKIPSAAAGIFIRLSLASHLWFEGESGKALSEAG